MSDVRGLLLLLIPSLVHAAPATGLLEGGKSPPPEVLSSAGAALISRLPPFFHADAVAGMTVWQVSALLTLIVGGLLVCGLIQRIALALTRRASSFTDSKWDDQTIGAAAGPLRYVLFAVLLAMTTRALALPTRVLDGLDVVASWVGIASLAWFALRFVKVAARLVQEQVAAQGGMEVGKARGLRTQVVMLRHVLEAVIYVLTLALMLLQLDAVRSIGMSLLASAGVAGLVIGLAAQKSISTLLAGIQLSITQPVRIGDTVIVENEWGWIEEITLTYVVVKVWDLRRLVVPMTYFLERPFQNWSKVTPDIMGTVELITDYRVDVDSLRVELKKILDAAPQGLWDGKVQGVQVTACTDRAMTVRVLVSSPDAGKCWDLRCLVREKLIHFLKSQTHGLPLVRAEATSLEPHAAPLPAVPASRANVLRARES